MAVIALVRVQGNGEVGGREEGQRMKRVREVNTEGSTGWKFKEMRGKRCTNVGKTVAAPGAGAPCKPTLLF